MEKTAQTDHAIEDVLARRWSPRAFADRPIEPEKIQRLFEAARWAASSFNEQPWRFFAATKDDPKAYEQALSCLVEKNQLWARLAPMLIITASKKIFSQNGKPNRVYVHDLGLAVGNLTVQATAMGLYVHQMAGVNLSQAQQVYDIPEDFEPLTAIAVGYPGDLDRLPEQFRQAERGDRTRKPLPEIVFHTRFGEPSPLVQP